MLNHLIKFYSNFFIYYLPLKGLARGLGLSAGGAGKQAGAIRTQANEKAIQALQREFGAASGRLSPFREAGLDALTEVERGATVGGLDERIAEILGTESFSALRGERERGLQGQLAAGGLTRSGTALQEAANLPTDLAFAIENALFGRQSNLVGLGRGAVTEINQLGSATAASTANLISGIGRAAASGVLADAQADVAASQSLFDAIVGSNISGSGPPTSFSGGTGSTVSGTQSTGSSGGGGAGSAGGLASAFSSFFSDPRLKENIEKIGNINNLNLYQWDWIDSTKGTVIENLPTIGFLTTEVKEHYPEYVFEFSGFEAIRYDDLLNKLSEDNQGVH